VPPILHLTRLRRTEVGHLNLADALTLDKLESLSPDDLGKSLISATDLLSHLPVVRLDEPRVRLVTTGRALSLTEGEGPIAKCAGASLRLCDRSGTLVAVGEYDPIVNLVKPRVLLSNEGF
jgi:tRNA U55 pseudouridine synthase TruB